MACVRGCCPDYRTHVQGVRIGGFPTQTTLTERQWDKDMPAYKRLVQDGLQPRQIDGAALAEQNAVHEKEIELGRAIDPATLSMMDDN